MVCNALLLVYLLSESRATHGGSSLENLNGHVRERDYCWLLLVGIPDLPFDSLCDFCQLRSLLATWKGIRVPVRAYFFDLDTRLGPSLTGARSTQLFGSCSRTKVNSSSTIRRVAAY